MDTRHRKALEALLSSSSRQEASSKCGVSLDTLRRYLLEPEFNAEYKARQSEILSESVERARKMISQSLDTLQSVLEDSNCSSSVKVTASKTLIESALKMIEVQEISERLCDLEKWKEARESEYIE